MKDLVGLKFNRWTVVSEAEKRGKHRYLTCKCDCGTVREVAYGPLTSRHSKSCGCWKTDERCSRVTHGHHRRGAKSPEYTVWDSMWQRCTNQNHKNFHHYGGRGIKVCDRWKSFEAFFEDMGERPPLMTLDRIENSQGYSPSNCRWASQSQQLLNTRRTKFIEYGGRTQAMKTWATEIGINYSTLSERIRKGWSVERAFTTPV